MSPQSSIAASCHQPSRCPSTEQPEHSVTRNLVSPASVSNPTRTHTTQPRGGPCTQFQDLIPDGFESPFPESLSKVISESTKKPCSAHPHGVKTEVKRLLKSGSTSKPSPLKEGSQTPRPPRGKLTATWQGRGFLCEPKNRVEEV